MTKLVFSVLLLVVVLMVIKNQRLPANLGLKNQRLAELAGSPNGVSTQTEQQAKRVAALPEKSAGAAASIDAAVTALQQLGGNTIRSRTDLYLHAVFTTPLMRYHDDVEIFLDETAGLLHFRSQSRVGYSDMGVNRQRYDAFAAAYQAQ